MLDLSPRLIRKRAGASALTLVRKVFVNPGPLRCIGFHYAAVRCSQDGSESASDSAPAPFTTTKTAIVLF